MNISKIYFHLNILEPEVYAEREARTYLADNQETILYAFLKNEAIEEEYQAYFSNLS